MTDDLLDRMEALCHDLTTARLRLHVAHSANDTFAADVADSEARVAEQSLAEAVPALVARCRAAEGHDLAAKAWEAQWEEANANVLRLESRLARLQEAGKAVLETPGLRFHMSGCQTNEFGIGVCRVEAQCTCELGKRVDAFAKALEGQ